MIVFSEIESEMGIWGKADFRRGLGKWRGFNEMQRREWTIAALYEANALISTESSVMAL